MHEDGVPELRRFVDWLSEGREQAGPFVAELLALPSSRWEEWLASHPDAATVHFFEGLRAVAESEPRRALALTDFILHHVNTVGSPAEEARASTVLHADTWRTRAAALRMAGDAGEALRAYEMSAAIFRTEPAAFTELQEVEREAEAVRPEPSRSKRLLAETEAANWLGLVDRPEFEGPGALAELSREIVARMERAPGESIVLAELATTIADRSPADRYPEAVRAELRALAWKDRGVVLRHVARYRDALDCLDRAESILEPFPRLDHDRAGVWLARAMTLQETNRTEESAPFIAGAKKIYERHGDRSRQLACGISEGTFLHRVHKYEDAIAVCEELLPLAEALNDLGSLGVLHNNIGHSATESGNYALATVHLDQAATLFARLGQPLRVARSDLARGRILVRKGDFERGTAYLRSVREEFLQHEMVEEAGLCGLEMVEAYLARGASSDAETLAGEIVRQFTAAELDARAITAVAYLSEAITARRASAETVDNVRQFISALRENPDAEFPATA